VRVVGRLLRALVALAVLVGVVAGVPALLATVGWPLPDHVPTLEELQRALSPGALTTDAVLKGLVVIGWVLWALVLAGSVVEAVAVLRHRQAPALPGVRPFQGFARWLVTSLTLSLGGGLSAAAPVLAQPMARPPAVVLALPAGSPPAQAAAEVPAPAPAVPSYVVQRNDSLVGIAGAVLGNPDRWSEIFELNYGVPQPTGGSLRSAGVIRAGWVLQLPADARVVAAAATEGAPAASLPEEDHVVRPGDNMWSIAEERVATASGRADGNAPDDQVAPYWSEVVATNAHTVRSGDPSVIYAGEHLRLPGVAGNGQAAAPPGSPPTPAPAGAASPSPAPAGGGTPGASPITAPPTTAAVPTTAAPTTAPPTTAASPSASAVRPGVVPAPPATNGSAPAPSTTVVAQGEGLRPNVSPAPVVVAGDAEEAPPATPPPA
jgi:LysM domain